jgi:hypothetical protein
MIYIHIYIILRNACEVDYGGGKSGAEGEI